MNDQHEEQVEALRWTAGALVCIVVVIVSMIACAGTVGAWIMVMGGM